MPKILTDDLKTKWMGDALKFLTGTHGRRWVSGLHCGWRWNMGFATHTWTQVTVTAMAPYAYPQNQKFKISISVKKKSWRPIFGTEKGFCWSTSCLLAQKLMPLHIVTSWHGFDEPFKTKGGECCQAACACSTTRTAKFRARHHWASGKIQMGYIGPSAVNPGSRAQRFPLGFFFSTKETSCWEKLDDVDEVQEEGMTWFKGKAEDFCNSGMQKPVPRLNKCLDNPGDCVEK